MPDKHLALIRGQLFQCVRQFLDTLGWQQAVLVGHDMAGDFFIRGQAQC
jgi:pimeloyl-ACP methyl ester carboxylesterase